MDKMNKKELVQYCKERKIDLYESMPKGFVYIKGALTAPRGTQWIYNKQSIFSKQRKTGLLITESL